MRLKNLELFVHAYSPKGIFSKPLEAAWAIYNQLEITQVS
jgi:hypothetical protein